jgi:hypothetical protein
VLPKYRIFSFNSYLLDISFVVVLAIQFIVGINCDIFDRITKMLGPIVVVFWFKSFEYLVTSLIEMPFQMPMKKLC